MNQNIQGDFQICISVPLSRFSVSLKSLDNYFFRWFACKSLFSRFSVLISYNMWSSNHFSISSCFLYFSGSRFFRVGVQSPGPGSRIRVQDPGPGFRSSPLIHLKDKDTNKIDEGNYACKIFVNFQKISDIVNHHTILKQLEQCGVRNSNGSLLILATDKSSHRRSSVKTVVLRNLAKFTGKHLCQSRFQENCPSPQP